jgi:hydroxymethylpyrimidine kinase/phosphomethylpyrimidine kinase
VRDAVSARSQLRGKVMECRAKFDRREVAGIKPAMSKESKRRVAMTIAGSDPSGGAGLQADLKTFAAYRVHGFSVITAVIAQNSARVSSVASVAAAMVAEQIATLAAERIPDALKTGALANAEVVEAVAKAIEEFKLPAPVVDPVLIASSGARLLDEEGEGALRSRLLPIARVITPNIPEAEALGGIEIDGPAAMRAAARALRRLGARAVVIKGGHGFAGGKGASESSVIDLLFDGRSFVEFAARRIGGGGAHGTGCAFSAAITARLACGDDLEAAVRKAKAYVTRALRGRFVLSGQGRALLDHFAGR